MLLIIRISRARLLLTKWRIGGGDIARSRLIDVAKQLFPSLAAAAEYLLALIRALTRSAASTCHLWRQRWQLNRRRLTACLASTNSSQRATEMTALTRRSHARLTSALRTESNTWERQCCIWSSRSNIRWPSTEHYNVQYIETTRGRAHLRADFYRPRQWISLQNQQFRDLREPVMHTHTKLQRTGAIRIWAAA